MSQPRLNGYFTDNSPSKVLAKQIASEALRPLGDIWTEVRYVPLDKLSELWGLKERGADSNLRHDSIFGVDGIVHGLTDESLNAQRVFPFINEFTQKKPYQIYEVEIFGGKGTFRRRFTLAHEIAHIVFQSTFASKLHELPGIDLESDIIDPAAGMIIVPDMLLANYFPKKYPLLLSIQLLEDVGAKMHVSISTLVKRIGDGSLSHLLHLENGALIVQLGRARKSGKDLAPRIVINCLPTSWFMPNNKRLSSLGAELLSQQFSKVELFKEREQVDKLILWRRSSWSKQKVEIFTHYKCYLTENDQRVMLIVVIEPNLFHLSQQI